jgi:hypothetical protein
MRIGLRSLALTQRRVGAGAPPPPPPTPTVALETTFTKTTSLTASFAFNYASSHAAGEFLVMVVTARSASAITFNATATDSAGNTYNKRVEGTQSNGATDTAIYDCTLTAPVTAATSITVTGNAVTYVNAQHATLFKLTNVTGYDSSAQAATVSSVTVTNAVTTGGPAAGVAVHACSTGNGTVATANSVAAGWTIQSQLKVSLCSQYTATAPSTSWVDPVTGTFNMDTSANYAGVIAFFA